MRDKQRQNEWRKENLYNQVGLRPTRTIEVTDISGQQIFLGPEAFVFRRKGEKTYQVFGSPLHVHFPRSLGRRVRVTINKNTSQIVGETDKCFV